MTNNTPQPEFKKKDLKNITQKLMRIVILLLVFFHVNANLLAISFKKGKDSVQCIQKTFDQEKKNWDKYDGYLIGRIILCRIDNFSLEKFKNKEIKKFIATLNYINISTKPNVILSKLNFKSSERINIEKLKDAELVLNEIDSIEKLQIVLEENEIDERYIDIKIIYKNVFPLMVNPFKKYIKYFNPLGIGDSLVVRFLSLSPLADSYDVIYSIYDIYNFDTDLTIRYYTSNSVGFAKIDIDKKLENHSIFVGGGRIISRYDYIDYIEFNKDKIEYKYKYCHKKFWIGKCLDIWISKLPYDKKLLFTFGYYDHFYSKKVPVTMCETPIMLNRTSYGIGICFVSKNIFKIEDSYGHANNDKMYEGTKFHLFGGILEEEEIYGRKYLGARISKGLKTNFGYFYLNSAFQLSTLGTIKLNSEDKYIKSTYSMGKKLGYISPKLNFKIMEIRQILGVNYVGRFGGIYRNLLSKSGYHYLNNYKTQFGNFDYKIQICSETIFYNPLKLFGINIDPYCALECLMYKFPKLTVDTNLKFHFIFGAGLLFNLFDVVNIQLGFVYSFDENKFGLTIQKPFLLESAKLKVDAPTYEDLD